MARPPQSAPPLSAGDRRLHVPERNPTQIRSYRSAIAIVPHQDAPVHAACGAVLSRALSHARMDVRTHTNVRIRTRARAYAYICMRCPVRLFTRALCGCSASILLRNSRT